MPAFTAKEATDLVLSRTRAAEPGTTRPFVRSLLDRTQQAVQAITSGFVVQVPLTVIPRQLIYPVVTFATGADDAPKCLRVERVTTFPPPKDIPEVHWRTLAQADRHWLRAVGSTIECWCRLGTDFIILYPALDEQVTITVDYAPIPVALVDDTDTFDLREDRAVACVDLAEVLILLRQRTPEAMAAATAHFQTVMDRMTRVKGTGKVGLGEGGFGVQNVNP